jgi:AcrR family transcriptional regulator
MSELRKKQRQKREEAIINAALKLVGDKGYRNTSIEEIAREAEVGTATVYNYFSSKQALFLSVLEEQVEYLLLEGNKVLENPPGQVQDAIFALINSYLSRSNNHFNKPLFRELIVVFLVEQLSVRKELMGMDYKMIGQLSRLIAMFQERGQIKPGLDPAEISLMLYLVIGGDLLAFVVDDDMKIEDFLVWMKRQVALLFSGFAP